ncbi:MAG: ABC transporter permease [Defluviitaleaceae bacterium]|nr:ABC transporter permease [Defluviitaleaceae bacterium]MCL2238836.1 ABC transporter permease [Defluviitaleaceae bacterium]
MIKRIYQVYIGVMLLFLYAPIMVMMALSFNESPSRSYWGGFSLRWYRGLFADPHIAQALTNTLTIALLSALIATVIGTIAAVGINQLGRRTKSIVIGITNLPVFNPEIVTGVSLMLLFMFAIRVAGMGRLGYTTLLLAHISFNVPYVILSVMPRLRGLDGNLFEAAMDLGATPMQALAKVILPQIRPGIITGALLAFTLSVDDFIVSFFTTGVGVSNLSILIFSMARRGVNPRINALSTLIFLTVMVLLYLISRRDTRKERSMYDEEN